MAIAAIVTGLGLAAPSPPQSIRDHTRLAAGHPLVALGDQRVLSPCSRPLTPRVAVGLVVCGLVLGLVADEHPFVVAQDHRVVGHRDEVVRHERNLAAAVRAIDHVGRDADAGHVAAKAFHDLHPLPHAGAEVARPRSPGRSGRGSTGAP